MPAGTVMCTPHLPHAIHMELLKSDAAFPISAEEAPHALHSAATMQAANTDSKPWQVIQRAQGSIAPQAQMLERCPKQGPPYPVLGCPEVAKTLAACT